MLAADAAKLRIVTEQVGEFCSLVGQGGAGQPRDAGFEIFDPKQFAQYEARVVEAQSLIEIAGDQILARPVERYQRCGVFHDAPSKAWRGPVRQPWPSQLSDKLP